MDSSVKIVRVFLRHSVGPDQRQVFHGRPIRPPSVPASQQRALVHVQVPAAEFRGLRIVGHDDDGLAVLAIQDLQQVQDLVGGFAVQIAGGLVAHQQLRIGDQRPRDRDPLRLAAGELAGLVLGAIRDADQGESRRGVCRSLRSGQVRQQQRQLDVALRVQHGHQVVELEHEAHVVGAPAGELSAAELVQPLGRRR